MPFTKNPANFRRFIEGLKAMRPDHELIGFLIAPESSAHGEQAFLILAEAVAALGDKTIYRYHRCDTWVFEYWKSRAYLTACIAIACKNHVHVVAKYADKHDLSALAGSGSLPGPVLDRLESRGRSWCAEDLALCTDVFLKGVDPEIGGFGVASALRLWLKLDDEGWMDTGLQKNVRPAFEAELASFEPIKSTRESEVESTR
jgi:hypothetical protein